MTQYMIPAADAPAEEWGRLAVSLPGWRWMEGMLSPCLGVGRVDAGDLSDDPLFAVDFCDAGPDPDDPATAGCLLALLGVGYAVATSKDEWVSIGSWPTLIGEGPSVGRACIAAAEALGRWPGGAA